MGLQMEKMSKKLTIAAAAAAVSTTSAGVHGKNKKVASATHHVCTYSSSVRSTISSKLVPGTWYFQAACDASIARGTGCVYPREEYRSVIPLLIPGSTGLTLSALNRPAHGDYKTRIEGDKSRKLWDSRVHIHIRVRRMNYRKVGHCFGLSDYRPSDYSSIV